MIVKEETIIGKSIEDVWEVIGNQFAEIDKWASLISHSEVSGESNLPGVNYSVRSTKTTLGDTKQELTSFNPEKYSLSYRAIEGTKSYIKSVDANWSLVKEDNNQTRMVLDVKMQTTGLIGVIITPLAKFKFRKLGIELLDDLKCYMENDKPSLRKLASMN